MKTILAISPNTRRLGYAIVRGAQLTDSGQKYLGVRTQFHRIHRVGRPFLRSLVARHCPVVIITAKLRKQSNTAGNRLLQAIKRDLVKRGPPVVTFSRKDIRSAFAALTASQRPSKDTIMRVLAKWFPELEEYVPPRPRRAWDAQDHWTALFDAVSLAITYLHSQ